MPIFTRILFFEFRSGPVRYRSWLITSQKADLISAAATNFMQDISYRFWKKVRKTPKCWLWVGSLREDGRGQFAVNRHPVKAHRFSYFLEYGNIPAGMEVMHKCDIPACVRPSHLILGTHVENMADMKRKGRANRPTGEKAPRARLTWGTVNKIRELAATKTISWRGISREFGVGVTTICHLMRGETWKIADAVGIKFGCE